MRTMGNDYVRNEFQLHKKSTSVEHLNMFYKAWDDYLVVLQKKRAGDKVGTDLINTVDLSDEQKHKLEDLRKETEEMVKRR